MTLICGALAPSDVSNRGGVSVWYDLNASLRWRMSCLGRKCYPCVRNNLLPMCPEWTTGEWLTVLDDFRNWLIRVA